MEEAFERILNLKAKFVEISHFSVNSTSIIMKDGEASEVVTGESPGVGIRILNRGWGFAYTSDLERVEEAASRAYKGSRVGNKKISLGEVPRSEGRAEVRPKRSFSRVPLEEKVELLSRAEEAAREPGEVVSTNLSYSEAEVESYYLNSQGARIRSEIPRGALQSQVFVKGGGRLQVGMERLGGTGGFEIFRGAEESAKKASRKGLRLLRARGAPSGSFPVVIDPHLTGVFIHEALGHAVEADHVLQGESIVADRLGERIASSKVNIYDDPSLEGSFGFYFYDNEGVGAQRTPLVKEGTLKNFLHSRETAHALGSPPTGNSRAQGFNFPPIPRMSNTYIDPGDFNLEELLEGIDYGVYLKGSKGGEVDPARGVFQFSAEEGFVVEKGEIGEGVRDVALSGETLKILQNIDAIGKDFDLSIGFCGKGSQAVPVGDGGASVRTFASVGGSE